MSRCFPFPPPGYVKKTKGDNVDSLKKVFLYRGRPYWLYSCFYIPTKFWRKPFNRNLGRRESGEGKEGSISGDTKCGSPLRVDRRSNGVSTSTAVPPPPNSRVPARAPPPWLDDFKQNFIGLDGQRGF